MLRETNGDGVADVLGGRDRVLDGVLHGVEQDEQPFRGDRGAVERCPAGRGRDPGFDGGQHHVARTEHGEPQPELPVEQLASEEPPAEDSLEEPFDGDALRLPGVVAEVVDGLDEVRRVFG